MSRTTHDLLIKDAMVVDGTGEPPRKGDILVSDDRIVAVEPGLHATATRTIDARGLTATPGFIDTHVHTDMTLLDDPVHECILQQGVTTVIMGQDGLSYAPLSQSNLDMFRRYLHGLNGNADVPSTWSSVAEYRKVFDRSVTLNTAYALPHSALRLETVGFRDVLLSEADYRKAQRLLEAGFADGAVALSTGLSYFPGTYGPTEELVRLSEIAAHAGKPYVTHIRTVFEPHVEDWLLPGLEEAMDIGRRSGVAVHVSHFGPKPGRFEHPSTMLEPVERANQDAVDVTLELYPYPAGATFALIYLPPWAHEGGTGEILARIRSGERRDELIDGIERNSLPPFGMQIGYLRRKDQMRYTGMRIDDIAQERGVRVGEAILQLLGENDLVVGGRDGLPAVDDLWTRYRDDMITLLERDDYMIGSDAIPVADFPHPRTYGTFPRVLRLARESGRMPLEAVIHLMTERPATRFGLTDRGVLRPGTFADIALFDAENVTDQATYDDPERLSSGVRHLFVNGVPVLDDGSPTDQRPGRAVP